MGVDTGFVVRCGSEKLARNRAMAFKTFIYLIYWFVWFEVCEDKLETNLDCLVS